MDTPLLIQWGLPGVNPWFTENDEKGKRNMPSHLTADKPHAINITTQLILFGEKVIQKMFIYIALTLSEIFKKSIKIKQG